MGSNKKGSCPLNFDFNQSMLDFSVKRFEWKRYGDDQVVAQQAYDRRLLDEGSGSERGLRETD